MGKVNYPEDEDERAEEPAVGLERYFIEAYLASKGHTWEKLRGLPEGDVRRLMTEACTYASTKLAEVEARAQFVRDIHDAGQAV